MEFGIPKTYVSGTKEGCRFGGKMLEVSSKTADDVSFVVASVSYALI
jgi:hypothetical protein